MKTKLLTLLFIAIICSSCTKDEEEQVYLEPEATVLLIEEIRDLDFKGETRYYYQYAYNKDNKIETVKFYNTTLINDSNSNKDEYNDEGVLVSSRTYEYNENGQVSNVKSTYYNESEQIMNITNLKKEYENGLLIKEGDWELKYNASNELSEAKKIDVTTLYEFKDDNLKRRSVTSLQYEEITEFTRFDEYKNYLSLIFPNYPTTSKNNLINSTRKYTTENYEETTETSNFYEYNEDDYPTQIIIQSNKHFIDNGVSSTERYYTKRKISYIRK